jgi:hypothetical protein
VYVVSETINASELGALMSAAEEWS